MNKSVWLRRIRNFCGLLGGLLPFIAILSVFLVKNRPSGALNSISATYYNSPALAGILTAAALVLMCYDGYSKIDSVITTISGWFGIGIVLFPCSVGWLDSSTPVGFFQVPMHYSNLIHCACAALFFVLLSFNSFFLFTKTDDFDNMTYEKKKRNIVYKICSLGMLLGMVSQVLCTFLSVSGFSTMINEIVMLFFFSISWLTKGGAFSFLNDK